MPLYSKIYMTATKQKLPISIDKQRYPNSTHSYSLVTIINLENSKEKQEFCR